MWRPTRKVRSVLFDTSTAKQRNANALEHFRTSPLPPTMLVTSRSLPSLQNIAPRTPTCASRRCISNSPYGRTHVWKRRPATLPNPLVPKFPQKVIRSDGTSFTHWITSPKSLVRLTRDTTNNPHWNTGNPGDRTMEEETGSAGRMGRFSRKFEELTVGMDDADWMEEMSTVMKPEVLVAKEKEKPQKKGGKK
ncbi:hypothetical protein CPB83DRAFT_110999 [Crepidotus variabilis]|uniref:Uncharacterized protein n=1 Tax=Crepidotus variabilis TaxID=179855 RepID=A0A9P6JIX2_9AGAR|nr:hypothetical protein CPB83DRAFT_110999 [Crepidotus variabilis]